MMDHILDQVPEFIPSPMVGTIGGGMGLPSPLSGIGLPSPLSSLHSNFIPNSNKSTTLDSGLKTSTTLPNGVLGRSVSDTIAQGQTRTRLDADELTARLPPALAALRMGVPGAIAAAETRTEKDQAGSVKENPYLPSMESLSQAAGSQSENKDSTLDAIQTSGGSAPSNMDGNGMINNNNNTHNVVENGPILVNPKCSGYFVEPVSITPFIIILARLRSPSSRLIVPLPLFLLH